MMGNNPGASVKMAVATVLKMARAPPFQVQVTFWKYPYVTWVPSDLGHEPAVKYPEPYFYRFQIQLEPYGWRISDGQEIMIFKRDDEVWVYLLRFLDQKFPLGIPYKVTAARKAIDIEGRELKWSLDEVIWWDEDYYVRFILPFLRVAPRRDP